MHLLKKGNVIHIFWSKTEEDTWASIYVCRRIVREILSLSKFATVFQAEILAIIKCVQILIAMEEVSRLIRICSDSQTALGAVWCVQLYTDPPWNITNYYYRIERYAQYLSINYHFYLFYNDGNIDKTTLFLWFTFIVSKKIKIDK